MRVGPKQRSWKMGRKGLFKEDRTGTGSSAIPLSFLEALGKTITSMAKDQHQPQGVFN